MSREIKLCPFCGGEAVFKDGYQDEEGEWYSGYVRCEKCGTTKASVGLSDFLGTYRHGFVSNKTAHECSLTAIERWNTRHERTCRSEDGYCSQCGTQLVGFFKRYTDEEGFTWGCKPYCPGCGARVTNDD